MARVLMLTGPPGAGKTTIARAVVARLPLAVHLETDWFFAAIRSGFIEPWLDESHRQNEVVVRAAARAAATYAQGGYDVVVDGVVYPWALSVYREELAAMQFEPVYVVLMPGADDAVARGLPRHREREPDEAAYRELHRQFVESAPTEAVLMTEGLGVDEITALVLQRLEKRDPP